MQLKGTANDFVLKYHSKKQTENTIKNSLLKIYSKKYKVAKKSVHNKVS